MSLFFILVCFRPKSVECRRMSNEMKVEGLTFLNRIMTDVPRILVRISECGFWFVIAFLKYLNVTTFWKDLLDVFVDDFCAAFWWGDMDVQGSLIAFAITSAPDSLLSLWYSFCVSHCGIFLSPSTLLLIQTRNWRFYFTLPIVFHFLEPS
jgi:hypothetical protein